MDDMTAHTVEAFWRFQTNQSSTLSSLSSAIFTENHPRIILVTMFDGAEHVSCFLLLDKHIYFVRYLVEEFLWEKMTRADSLPRGSQACRARDQQKSVDTD